MNDLNQRSPCFVAGTLVSTKEGLKPIEEIRVGDWVRSYPDNKIPPVRQYRVGGLVLSYPDGQILPLPEGLPQKIVDEYYYRQVTKTFVTDDQLVSYMEVSTFVGSSGDGFAEWIGVTPNHPIYERHPGFRPLGATPQHPNYQEPREGDWRPVAQLKFGSSLTRANFGNALVSKVRHEVERTRVYNLEVDEFHTYFVGEDQIWVRDEGNVPDMEQSL